MQLFGYPAASV